MIKDAVPSQIAAAYSQIAERYALESVDNAYNANYERPATLSLLPDVSGLRVLDAGCGPGSYATKMIAAGATVVGVDVSESMLRQAQLMLGNKIELHHASLTDPMDFLETASFDVVLSALVLDSIEDWHTPFSEFWRLLRSPGVLVFSAGHPMAEYRLSESGEYFQKEVVLGEWTSYGITIPSYRRPLSEMIAPLSDNGFLIDRIIEPKPTEECKLRWPEIYASLTRDPQFICIRAIKGKSCEER